MRNKANIWHGCPIRYGAGIFGDKWTLLILRDIIFKDKKYYGEFHEAGEGISTNILADRLAKLESNNIIRKRTDPEHLSRVIYSLTEKGLDLIPVMVSIIVWAEQHDSKTKVNKSLLQQIKSKTFIGDLRRKLASV